MKRKLSESVGNEYKETISDMAPPSYESVMELINNRQSSQLKEVLDNPFKDINLKNDDSLLMRASKVGDEECAKLLIAHGADVSFVSHYSGHTALTLACRHGHESIVKLLLEHGAEVNADDNVIPLVEACGSGNVGVVELLLNSGAQVNEQPSSVCEDPDCRESFEGNEDHYHEMPNALMIASDKGYTAIVALLLKHGADVEIELERLPNDCSYQEGFTALTFASQGYHWDVVKLLVPSGADINTTISYGDSLDISHPSPLMHACEQGNIEVVKELLELGADINAATWDLGVQGPYNSPLIAASSCGHIDLVKYILAHDKFTAVETIPYALIEAYEHRRAEIVEMLKSLVCDLNVFYEFDSGSAKTPLSKASEQGQLDSMQLLLDMGADINAPVDKSGGTALMSAIRFGSIPAAKFLLEHGASVDAVNSEGETALMITCDGRKLVAKESLINLLVEHGADVNKVDNRGNTLLMRYVSWYSEASPSVVRALLDYGTDVTIKNREGETVFDILLDNETISTERQEELLALCKQYEESNRRANVMTPPVLK